MGQCLLPIARQVTLLLLLIVSCFIFLYSSCHISQTSVYSLPIYRKFIREADSTNKTGNVLFRRIYGPSLAGIVGSNARRRQGSLSVKLSGRGLCDELIIRPEESYRLWFIVVCDLETYKSCGGGNSPRWAAASQWEKPLGKPIPVAMRSRA